MTRQFHHQRLWQLDDLPFRVAAELLAAAARHQQPQHVVGIDRGGRRLAELLAEHLNLPSTIVTARHNATDDMELIDTGRVQVEPIDAIPPARRILLADDICGSGGTLTAVTEALAAAAHPTGITTAVLCRNAGAAVCPDLWIWDVADWVVFPWERPASRPTEPLPTPTSVRTR